MSLDLMKNFPFALHQGCQPPTSSNIENNYDGEGMIGDIIMHGRLCKKKMRKKDVVGIVPFDVTGLLPTDHVIAYITMAYQSL